MESIITIRWAWKKLREWLKENCVDIDTYKLGDMNYCLEKFFQTVDRRKPNKKSTLILLKEYNNKRSPIYKGVKYSGLTLKRKSNKEKRSEYDRYIRSQKWRTFRSGIIKQRGESCERCRCITKKLELHHKTYARLFKELPEDVILLCKPCHEKEHNRS